MSLETETCPETTSKAASSGSRTLTKRNRLSRRYRSALRTRSAPLRAESAVGDPALNGQLMKFSLPKLSPTPDVSISNLPHLEQTKRLIAGGARFLQLREKNASPRDFYEAAKKVTVFARQYDTRIIINDRVDIALAMGAD